MSNRSHFLIRFVVTIVCIIVAGACLYRVAQINGWFAKAQQIQRRAGDLRE